MKFTCAHCGQKLEVSEEWAGIAIDCPGCGRRITIPHPVASAGVEPVSREPIVSDAAAPAARATAPRAVVPVRAPRPQPIAKPRAPGAVPIRAAAQARPIYRPPKKGGSGFGKLVLLVLLLAAGGFGYALVHFKESPLKVWKRLAAYAGKQTPAPTPPATPASVAPSTPVPKAEPAPPPPAPPTPPPADPLTWLRENRHRWPKEVTLLALTDFPAVMDGKVVGSVKAPAGSKVTLVDLKERLVEVVFNGGGARVPLDATDLRKRAAVEMGRPEPVSTSAPVSAPQSAPPPAAPAWEVRKTFTRKGFVHPGLLHTEGDFERMRKEVKAGKKPWVDGYGMLTRARHAQLNYGPRPIGTIFRGGRGQNFALLFNDIHAAYQLALRWKISGEKDYAEKSISVINAWSSTLKRVQGNADRFLCAGIYGYQLANAAEIMRTYPGWSKTEFKRLQDLMLNVIYPMNKHFLTAHNGAAITNYWANWDLCNIASMQSIGVLCDREDIYDEAMDYFKNGKGNGAMDKAIYYVHDGYLGQWQESGRDQGHTTLGIALMGPIMETAWNQGEDWYGYGNNLFLAAAEYVAKYNLRRDVPFQLYAHGTGTNGRPEVQPGISPAGRGHVRAGFELVIGHYRGRRGLDTPWTEKYAAQLRPEGGAGGHASSFDQFGLGTLTHTRTPEVADPAPSGLTVQKRGGTAVLSWWGAAGAASYHVKRAASANGPYLTIARNVTDLLTYTDATATSGRYFYLVTGVRENQETKPSNVVSFSAAPLLLTHLRFDETSGNVARNATDEKKPAVVAKGSWTAGRSGGSVLLNGKDSYVSLPGDTASTLADFTIAAWIYLDAPKPWTRLFDFGDDRGRSMFLTLDRGNGMPRFQVSTVYGYNPQRVDGTKEIPPKRWMHVAFTLSGRKGTIYLDGAEAGSFDGIDFPPFRLGNVANHWIGRSQIPNDPYLDGKLDDFRIYDGALSPQELAFLLGKAGDTL